jgi:O-antigen biosynthesis protein WbqP
MYQFVKRFFDIVASAIALLTLFPVWIVAIFGVIISDPGPIFYFAHRVGKDNQPFKMYKFRSMKVDKNADEKSLRPNSDRIFFWGRIMRDTKIDELPQLINVFLGDMSVIGPRPASSDQVNITRAGKYAEISRVKPGLSGPAALYDYIFGDGITDESEYEELVLPTRLNLDLYYLQVRSISYDLKMIWWTILSIFAHGQRKRILAELVASAKLVEVK